MFLFMSMFLFSVKTQAQSVDRMFYSPYYFTVSDQVLEGAKKHAIYSYIVANAATPGLDLVALLPPADKQKFLNSVPEDAEDEQKRAAIMEFVLAEMSINNRRTSALAAIWGGKAKSLKNVVTLGK